MRETEAVADARRAMEICNACRFCEGFCAVFPAMEQRREFSPADLGYLANLCHGCRGCFYACQYAPPHEFGINVPQAFARVRAESYADYAWPSFMGGVFARSGTVVSVVAAAAIAVILLLASGGMSGAHVGAGAFYAVIPYGAMVWVAGMTFVYALVAMAMSGVAFWRAGGGGMPTRRFVAEGLHGAMTLKNLGGGGDGCNYPGEALSGTRKWLHHALFYGFLLCFAATSVATLMHHVLGWVAPYSWYSLPVVFGFVGGVLMTVGACGLIGMKAVADPAPAAMRLLGGEYALLFLLLLVAVTGLALLLLRATGGMGALLAVHLGCVLALFLVMPYSKFIHGVHRSLALVRDAMER